MAHCQWTIGDYKLFSLFIRLAYIIMYEVDGGNFVFRLYSIPIHIFVTNYLVFTINQQSTNTPSELLRVDLSVLKDNTHTRPSVYSEISKFGVLQASV